MNGKIDIIDIFLMETQIPLRPRLQFFISMKKILIHLLETIGFKKMVHGEPLITGTSTSLQREHLCCWHVLQLVMNMK